MPLVIRLAVILTVVLVSLSTLAQITQKAAKPTNSSISGLVTVDSKPAGGVIVILLPQTASASGGVGSIRTKTNQDGSFHLSGLPEGSYLITALATAFVLESSTNDGLSGKMISIDENENVENIELKLIRGGVITGRVTDTDGHPVIEAVMSLELLPEQNYRRPLIPLQTNPFLTDDCGIYRFYGVPEGKYKVSVSQQMGVARRRTYYPASKDGSQAKMVEINPGSEVKGIDIKVNSASKTYEASGHVIDEKGQSVSNILLGYYHFETTTGTRGSQTETSGSVAQVDAQGEFRLVGLVPGHYTLYAQPTSGQPTDWYSEPTIFDVSSDHISGLEVRVKRGGSISGMVVIENGLDEGLKARLSTLRVFASVTPDVGVRGMMHQLSGKVDASGVFRITGIGPGRVRVGFDPRTIKGLTLEYIELNGRDQASGFSMGSGENITGVRVLCSYSTGVVKGQVQIQGGTFAELTGLSITCRRIDNPLHRPVRVQLDARGRFAIENMLPGEYTINAIAQPIQRSSATIIPRVSQQVSVVNGVETSLTLVINLGANRP